MHAFVSFSRVLGSTIPALDSSSSWDRLCLTNSLISELSYHFAMATLIHLVLIRCAAIITSLHILIFIAKGEMVLLTYCEYSRAVDRITLKVCEEVIGIFVTRVEIILCSKVPNDVECEFALVINIVDDTRR